MSFLLYLDTFRIPLCLEFYCSSESCLGVDFIWSTQFVTDCAYCPSWVLQKCFSMTFLMLPFSVVSFILDLSWTFSCDSPLFFCSLVPPAHCNLFTLVISLILSFPLLMFSFLSKRLVIDSLWYYPSSMLVILNITLFYYFDVFLFCW